MGARISKFPTFLPQPSAMSVSDHNKRTVTNFVNGKFEDAAGADIPVTSPADSKEITKVVSSTEADTQRAIDAANQAFPDWSSKTMKFRAAIMMKFHYLIREHADELADLIVLENGKNKAEALADVAKGNETVEYACSLPQVAQGKILEVSGGIHCRDERVPLGVVACVVPFNFPLMVPMWTTPIALVMGNCVVLKPSEKVPLTMRRVCELMQQAGFPAGVFNTVNGTAAVVNALIDSPVVRAVTFVGSSKVAELVATRCHKLHKRVVSLGGAKNHLVALPDADVNQTATDVVASFAGCCGQRCMAASVLLVVDPDGATFQPLLDAVVKLAGSLKPGQAAGEVGPLIDEAAYKRVNQYVTTSTETHGATLALDGRGWQTADQTGFYVGPTVMVHSDKQDPSLHEEIFGPVLSVFRVSTPEEALEIENANPYGNAACVYTRSGGAAEYMVSRFRAGMLGVNVGIPVPREPFSFGGLYGTQSKYGDGDITGDAAIEFFSTRRKVTVRWGEGASTAFKRPKVEDAANFNGKV
mmetsp:Transcript_94545/g.216271  ORF Transcript_94545/g.216271 Transcript_94545/m.216271 type:complete len:529 (-) Transcript_94545:307-1893(-)